MTRGRHSSDDADGDDDTADVELDGPFDIEDFDDPAAATLSWVPLTTQRIIHR